MFPILGLAGKCPRYGLVISRVMSPANRLRHFPRESLIACLSSGEASIVKVEVAALRRNDLDDAQRATQSSGDSRGAGVNLARMRTGPGHG